MSGPVGLSAVFFFFFWRAVEVSNSSHAYAHVRFLLGDGEASVLYSPVLQHLPCVFRFRTRYCIHIGAHMARRGTPIFYYTRPQHVQATAFVILGHTSAIYEAAKLFHQPHLLHL